MLINISLVCILLGLLFAPLGSMLVWHRKAYFSDGLTHACLLAGSISSAFDIPGAIASPAIAVTFAILIFLVKDMLTISASVNLISSMMLAIGMLIASIFPSNVNINSMLFGDILSSSTTDIAVILGFIAIIYPVFFAKIDDIIVFSLSYDLASARGINIKKYEIIILVILSLVISMSMKVIGALLVTALLMIPSYTASLLSKTPIQMIYYSFVASVISSACGIILSFYYDLATSPSIILGCSVIYFIVLIYKKCLLMR